MNSQDSLEKGEKENNSIVYGLLKNNLKIISIIKLPFIIGRNEKSDLVINNPSISKKHAIIQFDEVDRENNNINKDKNIILIDNSLNGTYVNGIKITNGKKILLETGDKISFGNDKIIYIFEVMNYDNDKTVIYPNMFGYNKIESNPISLVNEDYYQKSEINHFNGQIN
jgi:pSer/pThr/pTyr-binding forkhead associated (FHA) protein